MGLLATLGVLTAGAQGPKTKAQAYVNRVARQEPLKGSVWGVLAVNSKGDTLARYNAGSRMVPASNMKLITTGAALHKLGGSFTYETGIGYSGKVEGGILKGDLYIIGGGDPTLAAPDSIATPTFTLFSRWKNFLLRAGIKQIEGRVIGDGRYFNGANDHQSWNWEDIGTEDGTGGSGLSYYKNRKEFGVAPGKTAGAPVIIREGAPETPWMRYEYRGVTAPAGTGDNIYLFTTDLAPVGEIRGTYALGRKLKTERFSNKFGALTCAYHFCQFLVRGGIPVTGGPADIDKDGRIRCGFESAPTERAASSDSLVRIGNTQSPTLARICRETNFRSDNFYAETLLRTLGKKETGTDNYDSSATVERKVLESLGLRTEGGIVINDGSGLSRKNNVSPAFFVQFLAAMRRSPAWKDYLASLPVPGSNGTMHFVLSGLTEDTKQRIHLKSGSMSGILCYSGYILPKEGGKDTIYFSIMTGNGNVDAAKVRPVITQIIALLAE